MLLPTGPSTLLLGLPEPGLLFWVLVTGRAAVLWTGALTVCRNKTTASEWFGNIEGNDSPKLVWAGLGPISGPRGAGSLASSKRSPLNEIQHGGATGAAAQDYLGVKAVPITSSKLCVFPVRPLGRHLGGVTGCGPQRFWELRHVVSTAEFSRGLNPGGGPCLVPEGAGNPLLDGEKLGHLLPVLPRRRSSRLNVPLGLRAGKGHNNEKESGNSSKPSKQRTGRKLIVWVQSEGRPWDLVTSCGTNLPSKQQEPVFWKPEWESSY